MQAGGVTEIITHFIGHLQLLEESARARIVYDEFAAAQHRTEGETGSQPDETLKLNIVPLAGHRINFQLISEETVEPPDPVGDYGSRPAAGLKLPTKSFKPGEPPFEKFPGGGGGGRPGMGTQYEDRGPGDTYDTDQVNTLKDNDVLLVKDLHLYAADLFRSDEADVADAIASALEELPAHLPGGEVSVPDLVAWAHGRTPEQMSEAPSGSLQSLRPGRFINGEKVEQSEDGTEGQSGSVTDVPHTDLTSWVELVPPSYKYGETDLGQVVRLGGNTAENIAVMIDPTSAVQSMIVLGDWFETNAIIQVNVFSDNDLITKFGDTDGTHVETGGNVLNNMADFIEANPWADEVFPKFAGRNFNIDVVNGDFYDVKAFTQKNWIQDNDVVVQNEHTAFYQVDAGLNQQLNVAALVQEFLKYDVIIVGGDYHSANLIFQTNIVLDDDFVMLSVDGDGEGGDYTILAGQNWLLNSATIRDLGVDQTSPVSDNLVKLCEAIAGGQEQFDPTLAHELSGNGSGTLNVLYVSGDYYDLNLLYQINVILDADTAVQYLPAGAQDAEDFLQYAATGNNAASNQAELINVGVVEELFVAGDHYEDELLVQTNIIVPEGDEVVVNDPSSVPPELAVFVTDQTSPAANTGTSDVPIGPDPAAPQQDMLGGVMH